MTTYNSCPELKIKEWTLLGAPASGYKLYSFVTGGSVTPLPTYSNSTGTANNYPVVLDGRGEATIYLDPSLIYRFKLTDPSGTEIWTRDGIQSSPNITQLLASTLTQIYDAARIVFNSVDAMRTGFDKTTMTKMETLGYYAPGEGGGKYWYDSSDIASSDNGGTVIVANDGSRLKLQYKGFYHVKQFGVLSDGSTDDLAKILAAITACPAHGEVSFSGVTSVISGEITIPNSYITLSGPCKIAAKAATNFEYMLRATSLTEVIIKDFHFDANKTGRSSGQNVRFMGAAFTTCTDSKFISCTVENCLGYSSVSAVGLALASGGTRCSAINCYVLNCGGTAGTDSADGIFTSGTQNVIANCIASACTDTGFVIESSNYSVISGCTAVTCSAGAAITNATDSDVHGNIINGLTISNWSASNTGGIQIGVPTDVNIGNLLDSEISNVVFYANTSTYGAGPAIDIRKGALAKATGVTISNVRVNGSKNQGILVDANDVVINNFQMKGGTDACIQFKTGTTGGVVQNSYLNGGTYGVISVGTAVVITQGNVCTGNGYGLFAQDTSTITSVMNIITSPSTARTGKDAGATMNYVGIEGGAPAFGNSSGTPPSGSLTNKVLAYDRNGNTLGYIAIYNI